MLGSGLKSLAYESDDVSDMSDSVAVSDSMLTLTGYAWFEVPCTFLDARKEYA